MNYVVRVMRDKKKLVLIFLFGCLYTVSHAVEYAPFATSGIAPAATMQSVNNSGYMSSGSTYASSVYEVGSSAPSRSGARKAPPPVTPGTEVTDGYDPTNPQFSPLADACLPLMLLAVAYAVCMSLRRRKRISA